jgi:histidine triad (HIT) family protein
MDKTIFQKIIEKEIPSDIIFEDELCIVIKDINPQAPIHLLIIPKKPIPKLADASKDDLEILGHLMLIVGNMSRQFNVEDAFNVVINNGVKAGQTVFHLHIHLLAGNTKLNLPK